MIINMSGGGPGAILNFKVLGGTAVPSNPCENMIWVNTGDEITNWMFSATRPESLDGKVWVKTSTTGKAEFNALKKNAIHICPIAVYQWDGNSWVSKPAKIYRSGEWSDILSRVELYKAGDECIDITGGWTEGSTESGSLTKNSTYLALESDAYSAYAIAITNEKINISGGKTLTINATNANTNSYDPWHSFGLTINKEMKSSSEAVAYRNVSETGNATLDISNVSDGEYYIYLLTGGVSSLFDVDNIWIDY